MEKARRKKLGGRILGVILSLVLMLGLMPEMPGSEMVVQAAGSEPGAAVYATKNQLMNDLGPAGGNTTIGKLVFGKNSSGEPLEWYILGKDTGVSGDNTAIFTTSPIYGAISYYPREDVDSYNGGDATYENGFVPNWRWSDRNVNSNNYCLSKVYKELQDMANDTSYFTEGEQSLMQATTVTTRDIINRLNYTTTDKLYLLTWENQNTHEKILAGTNANIIVPWGKYWKAGDAYFWLRSPFEYEDYDTFAGVVVPQTGEMTCDRIYDEETVDVVVRPASNINLTNVLFASAATAASSDVATGTIPAGKAMVLRLDGSNKNMGSVVYFPGGVLIAKKAPEATGTVSLVVQGNDGTNDWYYSKVIGENTTLSETDIESALASNNIAAVNLSDCKIWLETTGDDGLCYAINAEERTSVSTLEITDIVAPIAGLALDDEAVCATVGVLDTTPSVIWKAGGNEATGTAENGTVYTASVTLSLPASIMWENTATATVNGKNATSITENNDNTITITYEFPAARKDRLVSITAPQSITVESGTAYDAMNLPDTVSIVTEGNTLTTANVVWDIENPVSGSYNPAISTEQTVTLRGTVTCPERIDTNDVVLTTSITITINAIYQIANAEELYQFAEYVSLGNKNARAELTADIDFDGWDFSSKPWTPICQTKSFHATATTDTGYSGTFDGNGYTISNLTVAFNSDTNNVYSHGLFGTVSGTVKNLGMVGLKYINTTGDTRAGSVAGQLLTGGTITNCYSVGHSIKTNNNIAGGIAGCNYGGTISNCYALKLNGTVTGYGSRWGGLVGDCQKDDGATDKATTYGTVSNCYTDDTRVVSTQSGNATITNCEVKAATAFTSGEVAYLLNGSTNGGTTWYQTLSDNSADAYPVLNSASGKVYRGYDKCKVAYANDNTGLTEESGEHSWEEGTCSVCGEKCSHSWEGNICEFCKMSYTNDITVVRADGGAFEAGEYTFDCNTKVHTINTDKEVKIFGTTTTEKIDVASGVSANIILAGVTIDVSRTKNACAFMIEDDSTGNVTITLADGKENTLRSGTNCAGLQKNGAGDTIGTLIIQGGENGTGSLTVKGGYGGAGIGGGSSNAGSKITISGGTITATGGYSNNQHDGGAGIGGGKDGAGSKITISGGSVTAKGGKTNGKYQAAGIGGGSEGTGSEITISGGSVTATGGCGGAGIGGGYSEAGSKITISGGSVTATGGSSGAGIGGGYQGTSSEITINGGSVKAIKGYGANAIGGGMHQSSVTPTLKDGTPVYLLEIANENNLDIVINDTDYPDKHFDESKIYAYLPAKTEAEPNGVTVGNAFTGYYYDTTVPEWKQATATNHTHEDTDSDCVCDSCRYAYKHVDANKDSYCDVCGTIIDGIGATLAGYSLSLDGNIGVNFCMELDASVLADDTAYMQFTLPNVAEPVKVYVNSVEGSLKEVAGKNYYVFTCEVAAKEMADTITAQMFCSDGNGGTRAGTAYEYSVKQYAEDLLGGNTATDAQKKLAKAMLNYGAYAQLYFGYNTNNLANAGNADNELAVMKSELQSFKPVVDGENETFTYAGSTLLLEADVKVRHYFKLKEGQEYTGSDLTLYAAQPGDNLTGTYYYWESAGIPAASLGTMTEYTGVSGITINYCPLSYVTTAVVNTDGELLNNEELQNLLKALYLYYQATK